MGRCASITRAGGRCKLDATHGSFCYQHSSETLEERRRNARRGGRAGGNGRGGPSELVRIKRELRQTIDAVRGGELERGRGAVCLQGYGYLLRTVELERRLTESDVEERILRLEETLSELIEAESRWRRA